MTAQLTHTIVWCRDKQKSATSLARHRDARINHNDGGRGMCLEDPGGHLLEIINRAHGSGGRAPSDWRMIIDAHLRNGDGTR